MNVIYFFVLNLNMGTEGWCNIWRKILKLGIGVEGPKVYNGSCLYKVFGKTCFVESNLYLY